MISRPTTQQLLDDCAREVRETLAPLIADPAVRVRMEMLEQLIASCAVRSAHEIAWMVEECQAMDTFTAAVVEAYPNATVVAETRADYVEAVTGSTSLHLDDCVRHYDLAGRAFSEALDVAMRGDRPELAEQARKLIVARTDREGDTRPGFFFPGRS